MLIKKMKHDISFISCELKKIFNYLLRNKILVSKVISDHFIPQFWNEIIRRAKFSMSHVTLLAAEWIII